ncbi:MAG TPA: hypothetical protein VK560_07355, partial [Gemmatimonadaceae bacterium]|nr:hypothetical protein [Gemmatimonadaceae bacterium]
MRPVDTIFLAAVTAGILAACEKPAANTSQSPTPSAPGVPVPTASGVTNSIPGTGPRPAVEEAANQTSIAPAELLALNEDGGPNALDLITAKIDTTITLGAWLKSHPSDKISEIPPVSGVNDPFCRGAVAQAHLMGRPMARYALFYIPALSKAEKLPTDTAKAPGDYCELRTVVLVSEEMDFPHGHALSDSLAVLIQTRLGSPREGLPLGAGGVRGMPEGKIWNGPGTKVMVATGPVGRRPDPAARNTGGEEGEEAVAVESAKPELARTYAVAYAPGSGAQDFDTWESRYHASSGQRMADQQQQYADVDSALVWAAVPSLSSDLGMVLTSLKGRDPDNLSATRPAQVDAALLRALRTIHNVAPTLPAPRRAAALMAGDVMFAAYGVASTDSNGKVYRTLDSLGMSFVHVPGENGIGNTRAWLWQAWQIDSTGRAGRAAFVRLLELWWPTGNGCSGDEYSRIIKAGEAELKRG